MKISKLLVLAALLLTSGSAMATIVDGIRQKPVPSATQGFVASDAENFQNEYYYLYNVDAQAFFTEGNAWGTQVSVGNTGLKVAFTPDAEYELSYIFNDYAVSKSSWKVVFFDNENQMFVDHNGQANYRWGVEENGNTFRLFAASEENGNPGWAETTDDEGNVTEHPAYREGLYMGWDSSSSSTACVPYLAEGEGHCINWALVTEDVYNAYAAEIEVYAAAEKLRVAIEDAQAKGFTATADYEAVYANEAATVAELEKALTDLNDAIVEWGKNNATVENPADMTSKIVNPRFDGDDLKTGWSTAFNANGGKENAEYWNMNYNTHQDIVGLPEGVYALGAKAFYRAGSNSSSAIQNWLAHNEASRGAKLYAITGGIDREAAIVNVFSGAQEESKVGGDVSVTYTNEEGEEVTVWVPNNMSAGEYYMHTLDLYDNKMLFATNEGDTVTIGVRKTNQISDEWSLFDDFSLTYYGKGGDAYQLYLDDVLKNYGEVTLEDGTIYTEAYLTAYQEALAGEHKASSKAEVDAILLGIEGGYDALMKNIELWKQYQKQVKSAFDKYVVSETYADLLATGDLADYCEIEYEEIMEALALTNEELEAEIAKVEALVQAVLDEFKNHIEPGTDVTDTFLKNPDFEDGIARATDPNGTSGDYGTATGWHADKHADGNFTPGPLGSDLDAAMTEVLGAPNHCFEAWHCHDFDLWQEVENAPVGVYEIQVQGYVRCEVGGYQRGDLESDLPKNAPIYLYLNNAMTRFPDVYSETRPINEETGEEYQFGTIEGWTVETINGYDYPNSMGGAAQCFAWGMYKKSAYGLVAQQGDKFRIGVKGKMDTDWWCIWDNFKLIYRGFEAAYVQPALEEALTMIDPNQPMGKSIYEQALGAKERADAAIAAGDGKEMFKVLNDIYNLSAAITESVALFKELNDANESLMEAINMAEGSIEEASALFGRIADGIENHSFEDEEVPALLTEIKAMKTKLRLPADVDMASDGYPVDCSNAIENPNYDEGLSGWSGTAAAWSDTGFNAEIFGKNFDYYQEIIGLPAGTYALTVQGFYRAGSAGEDYTSFVENPTKLNHAFYYAVNGDSTVYSKPMARLASEAGSEMFGVDGYVTVKEATDEAEGLCVANTMTTASEEFDAGKYLNANLILKVLDDGKLTIGLKKNVDLSNNWTIWDNWKLIYFGKSSSQAPDGDASGIKDINNQPVNKVEFFTLDGRKASASQKGILIQKMTLGNGAIIVKKVRK